MGQNRHLEIPYSSSVLPCLGCLHVSSFLGPLKLSPFTIWVQKVSSCKHRFPWQHNRKLLERMFILSRPAVWLTVGPEHVCSCCIERCGYRFPCFPQNLLSLATVLVTWRKMCVCALPQSLQACSPQSAYSTQPYLKHQQLSLCCHKSIHLALFIKVKKAKGLGR